MNISVAILTASISLLMSASPALAKERLFVLTDLGNEPDDQMSLLLTYANEIDIECLVATTST